MARTSVEASILKEIEIDDEEDGVRAIENLVSRANGAFLFPLCDWYLFIYLLAIEFRLYLVIYMDL
jgi:hypothetical protein